MLKLLTFDNNFNLLLINSKNEKFFMFTNIAIESSKTEYFLKSKNFHYVKKLKFKIISAFSTFYILTTIEK